MTGYIHHDSNSVKVWVRYLDTPLLIDWALPEVTEVLNS